MCVKHICRNNWLMIKGRDTAGKALDAGKCIKFAVFHFVIVSKI